MINKFFGENWRTSLTGYCIACLVAIQPILVDSVDFTKKSELVRYGFRILFAAAIGIYGHVSKDK